MVAKVNYTHRIPRFLLVFYFNLKYFMFPMIQFKAKKRKYSQFKGRVSSCIKRLLFPLQKNKISNYIVEDSIKI